ncbi:MAG: hypothetical protein ACRDIV_17185 [Ktedonobacteraceae bacterium]
MKRFIRVAMLLCVVTVLLSILSIKTIEAKASTASGKISQNRLSSISCGMWSVVPSPNGNGNSVLNGVATVSANDVWAVGGSGRQASGGQTLIEHWNGTNWQVVTSPNPGSIYNALYGVTAVSASNAWAVGYYVSTAGVTQTLIEHWNGSSWSAVKSPSPASMNNELFNVAAVSASDVWAVGFVTNNTSSQTPLDQTLIEHWNGSSWSVVKSPNPGPGSSNDHLNGVTAISASNVWAVGNSNTFAQTLIEHWNGSHWSVVKSPSPGSGDDLRGVTAVSANNIWAVGYSSNRSSIQTLTEHWNGTSWQVVTNPSIVTGPSFSAVAAVSANDVWAVGDGSGASSNRLFVTLTEQWNGTRWSVVQSPSPGSFNIQLLGVAAVSANDVWAVGVADSNTLIENYHC